MFPAMYMETPLDAVEGPDRRRTGAWKYMRAKAAQVWDETSVARVSESMREKNAEVEEYGRTAEDQVLDDQLGAAVNDPEFSSRRAPHVRGPDASYMPAAADEEGQEERVPLMGREEYEKSEFHREGIEWSPFMTPVRARLMAEAFDERRRTQGVVDRASNWLTPLGVGVGLIVNMADPINYVPLMNPAKGLSWGRAAMRGAAEAAAGNVLADAVIFPEMARRGEDIGFADVALDLIFGAAVGGLAGGVRGALDTRAARKEAARAARLRLRIPERRAAAELFEDAVLAVEDGRPVNLARHEDAILKLRESRAFNAPAKGSPEALLARIAPSEVEDALVRSGPAAEIDGATVTISRKMAKAAGITGEQGAGFSKIIFRHGAGGGEFWSPHQRRDLTNFPSIVRDYEPVQKVDGDGKRRQRWRVVDWDGRVLLYTTQETEYGKAVLVTAHVEENGPHGPFSSTRGGEVSRPVASRGGGTGEDFSSGKQSNPDTKMVDEKKRVKWDTERTDEPLPDPADVEDPYEAYAIDRETMESPEVAEVRARAEEGLLSEVETRELADADEDMARAERLEESALSALECVLTISEE